MWTNLCWIGSLIFQINFYLRQDLLGNLRMTIKVCVLFKQLLLFFIFDAFLIDKVMSVFMVLFRLSIELCICVILRRIVHLYKNFVYVFKKLLYFGYVCLWFGLLMFLHLNLIMLMNLSSHWIYILTEIMYIQIT